MAEPESETGSDRRNCGVHRTSRGGTIKIAVINETSAADKNKDILLALEGREHEIINAGMSEWGAQPELLYIQTGLISASLLNLKRVDFVVGGRGTGQGYLSTAGNLNTRLASPWKVSRPWSIDRLRRLLKYFPAK